jgi:hypothetical protein
MNDPYLTMKLGLGSDKRHIDSIYPLSIFFAFGIYLVFDRYQKRYNSAVPFHWTHPEVDNFVYFFYDKDIHLSQGGGSNMGIDPTHRAYSSIPSPATRVAPSHGNRTPMDYSI